MRGAGSVAAAWVGAAALLVTACVAPPKDATDEVATRGSAHHRATYATTELTVLAPAVRGVVEALGRADSATRVTLDERLSLVASTIASEPRRIVGDAQLIELAIQAGSPYVPTRSAHVRAASFTDEMARGIAASTPGSAPLVIGVAPDPAHPDEVVIVLARKLFELTGEIPRRGARRVDVALSPEAASMTPTLLVVGANGVQRLQAARDGATWTFERATTFDGTIAALLGEQPATAPSMDRRSRHDTVLGALHFADPPALPGSDATRLEDAVAALRRAWRHPPLAVDDVVAPPCSGSVVGAVGGRTVTMRQRCVTWPSTGSDAQRWAALRFSPSSLDALAQDSWQLAQIRRDPDSTSIRVARAFEDLTVAEARARLLTEIARRFAGSSHDSSADVGPTAIAERWSSAPRSAAVDADVADAAAREAASWTREPRYFRLTWSDQELSGALDALAPDVAPTAYTLGVARGRGAEGEPRYFVVVYLALPRKP